MDELIGYIDSIYCGSAVDGRGLRVVVFFTGCNLRCGFCHNPETLYKRGEPISLTALIARVLRYKSYIKRGGVTLSGGEPFLQADFCIELMKRLNAENVSVALETNGHIADERLIALCEYIICDVKNQTTDDLAVYESFLSTALKLNKSVELTNVIIKGVNDNAQKLSLIKDLSVKFAPIVRGVRLLPFKKLCAGKYSELGLSFEYADKDETDEASIAFSYQILNNDGR